MYRKYRQIRQNIIYFKLYTNISKIPIAKINRNALIHTSSRAHIIRRVKLLNQVIKFNNRNAVTRLNHRTEQLSREYCKRKKNYI